MGSREFFAALRRDVSDSDSSDGEGEVMTGRREVAIGRRETPAGSTHGIYNAYKYVDNGLSEQARAKEEAHSIRTARSIEHRRELQQTAQLRHHMERFPTASDLTNHAGHHSSDPIFGETAEALARRKTEVHRKNNATASQAAFIMFLHEQDLSPRTPFFTSVMAAQFQLHLQNSRSTEFPQSPGNEPVSEESSTVASDSDLAYESD